MKKNHGSDDGRFTTGGSSSSIASGSAAEHSRLHGQDLGEDEVPSDSYNMRYAPGNEKIVAAARSVPDAEWEKLPVTSIPCGTVLHANAETLIRRHIDKVVSGAEEYREGYPAKVYQRHNNELHVVDGHTRAAICAVLGRTLPARVMTEADLSQIQSGGKNHP